MSFEVLVVRWLLVALAFDFMNGFHDAANSIATVVSTRVLRPHLGGGLGGVLQLHRVPVFGVAVAATIGKGIVDPAVVDHYVVFGALIGAIAWNLITWYYGIPSSSSHALIGGLAGAAVAKGGAAIARRERARQDRRRSIVLSPLARLRARLAADDRGLLDLRPRHPATGRPLVPAAAARLRRALQPRSRRQRRAEDDGHHLGAADRRGHLGANESACRCGSCSRATARSRLGTLFGGWRIVKTMGQRITKLQAGGRLLRGDRRRDHALPRHRPRHPGLDHAHHHRLDRRRRLGPQRSRRCAGASRAASCGRGS